MAASFETIDAIYKVIRKHCTDEQVQRIIADLQEGPGNKSFRDFIERLARLVRTPRPERAAA
jgi:hypothetical protein